MSRVDQFITAGAQPRFDREGNSLIIVSGRKYIRLTSVNGATLPRRGAAGRLLQASSCLPQAYRIRELSGRGGRRHLS